MITEKIIDMCPILSGPIVIPVPPAGKIAHPDNISLSVILAPIKCQGDSCIAFKTCTYIIRPSA